MTGGWKSDFGKTVKHQLSRVNTKVRRAGVGIEWGLGVGAQGGEWGHREGSGDTGRGVGAQGGEWEHREGSGGTGRGVGQGGK
jgi:hypothetical protein